MLHIAGLRELLPTFSIRSAIFHIKTAPSEAENFCIAALIDTLAVEAMPGGSMDKVPTGRQDY